MVLGQVVRRCNTKEFPHGYKWKVNVFLAIEKKINKKKRKTVDQRLFCFEIRIELRLGWIQFN